MAKSSTEFELKRKRTLYWAYAFVAVVALLFIFFVVRILFIQTTNVEEIQQEIVRKNYREATLKAARGNLYASDGSILATTVMRYDIYIDFKTIRDTLYQNNISSLTDSLSVMFNKPKSYFRTKLDTQKKKGNQYYSLVRGLDYDQYDRIRKFPIFKKGKNKGGFIVDRRYTRELSTVEIGRGTIGMDDERREVWLGSSLF